MTTPPDFTSPLPARPLPLDTALIARRFRQAVLVVVGMAVFTLFIFGMTGWQGLETYEKRTLWQRGTAATLVDFSGQVTERTYVFIPFGHDYDLDVVYKDAAGVEHTGKAKFDYLFGSVPEDTAPEVRVDPTAPEQFALSWQAEGVKPWSWPLALTLFGLAMAYGTVQLVRKARDTRVLPRLCAEDGHEVALEAASVVQEKAGFRVTYLLPGQGHKTAQVVLPTEPYVLETESGQRLLALESPRAPGQYLLLEASLAPFLVTPPAPVLAAEPAAKTGTF